MANTKQVLCGISTLEDMVKLHNNNSAIIFNNMKWLKRANGKTKFIALIALGGAAYATRKVSKLAAKLDKLEESHRALERDYDYLSNKVYEENYPNPDV